FFIGVLLVYFGFGVDGLLLGTLVSLVLATIFFQDAWRGVSWALVDKEQLTRLFAYGKMLLIKGAGSFFIGVLLVYFGFGVDGLLLGTLVSLVLATIFFQD
ncbi:hypothetical protein, partial [Pseudomonas aeruginosa]|uniref:hypothetical protein n=1 Tax=Pseudomonas aeruginosa TaxID=287 RepID=UPI0031B6893D